MSNHSLVIATSKVERSLTDSPAQPIGHRWKKDTRFVKVWSSLGHSAGAMTLLITRHEVAFSTRYPQTSSVHPCPPMRHRPWPNVATLERSWHWFRLAIQIHSEHVLTYCNYATRAVVTFTRRARYVPLIESQLGIISSPTASRMSPYMTSEAGKTFITNDYSECRYQHVKRCLDLGLQILFITCFVVLSRYLNRWSNVCWD